MKLIGIGFCALAFAVVACGGAEAEPAASSSNDELVGGTPDLRWPAAGYLVHAATLEDAASAPIACGATLVAPNVVVTAAHCVLTAPNDVWAFGTGNAESTTLVQVVSQTVHPDFHAEPTRPY